MKLVINLPMFLKEHVLSAKLVINRMVKEDVYLIVQMTIRQINMVVVLANKDTLKRLVNYIYLIINFQIINAQFMQKIVLIITQIILFIIVYNAKTNNGYPILKPNMICGISHTYKILIQVVLDQCNNIKRYLINK